MGSRMEQQRFTNLAFLSIEREIVNKIKTEDTLNKYATFNRKISLK